jgi:predicted ATPase
VSLASGEDLLNSIANAIGLRLNTIDNPLQDLQSDLTAANVLLVLDNFEHLLGQAKIVTDLLTAAPLCKIVVTSRVRLPLRGEALLDLLADWLIHNIYGHKREHAAQIVKAREAVPTAAS